MLYVLVFYRGYSNKADFVTEIGSYRKMYGGEAGIRTLGTFRHTRFPGVRLQPLGHLSAGFYSLSFGDTCRRYMSPKYMSVPKSITCCIYSVNPGFTPIALMRARALTKVSSYSSSGSESATIPPPA